METVENKAPKPAIQTQNVSFKYHKNKAVDDISLEIPKGISFGVLGPNGSGKTTFIRMLVGLLKPNSGKIRTLGYPPSRKLARYVGYMPQLPALYSELSIGQNVDFFARIYGIKNKAQRQQLVKEAITMVDLWPRRKDSIGKLSGGMKQRVDPALRVKFWEYFRSLTERGVTIIISSHTMDDAAHCDRLAFLREGKVIAMGSPEELKHATGSPEASLEDAFLYFVQRKEESLVGK